MRRVFALVITMMLVMATVASAAPRRLVFNDDFDGSSVSLAKWAPNWSAWGSGPATVTWPASSYEQSCYDPAQTVVSGGVAAITAVQRSCVMAQGGVASYASDLLSTWGTFSFTYGYVEARVYIPAAAPGVVADWPIVWTDGYGAWPSTGEIDVAEGSQGRMCHNYHSSAANWSACPALANPTGWHVFAADWQRGSVTFYVDGRQTGRVTRGVASALQFLNVGLSVQPEAWSPIVTPAVMLVDYVRVWK